MYVPVKITFQKLKDKGIVIKLAYFSSNPKIITDKTNIYKTLDIIFKELLNLIGKWLSEGSGWVIQSVDNHYLNIVNYTPRKGSSYIKLPENLQYQMKGLIKIKISDNECFHWGTLDSLIPIKIKIRVETKRDKIIAQQLNYNVIEFRVTIKQIIKIEKQNDIRVNVFGYENKQKFPHSYQQIEI